MVVEVTLGLTHSKEENNDLQKNNAAPKSRGKTAYGDHWDCWISSQKILYNLEARTDSHVEQR